MASDPKPHETNLQHAQRIAISTHDQRWRITRQEVEQQFPDPSSASPDQDQQIAWTECSPISFATWSRTIEAAQSDNARIEYLTARVLYLHGEVVALRARLDVLERDGNGERG